MKGFQLIDYAVFVAYLVASVLIGLIVGREQKSVKDYFLAGQTIGYIPLAISVIAALLSGISFLGIPAESYAHDLSFSLFINLAFFISTPATALLFLPFFYRLKLYTAYEYLERRFSLEVRLLSSGLFILRVVIWLALATYAPALALSEVTGFPLWASILLTGVLTTFYTTLGGMKAVIWTDVMQFFVLFGGIVVIIVTVWARIPGGLSQALDLAREGGRLRIFDFSLSLTTRTTFWALLVGGAFMNMVQMATDQVRSSDILQRRVWKPARRRCG
jgi:Na+/proline symporter